MFSGDLLQGEAAELARLRAENEALTSELARSRAAVDRIRQWFTDGGPDDADARDSLVRSVCERFLTGRAEPALVTAAAVALVESWPSGASDAHLVAAAVACRQVVTFAELAQARLTRELAWRYESHRPEELDLGPDTRIPEWVRDPDQRALTAAVEEVAAHARGGPGALRDRVDMLAAYPESHPVLYRALLDGTISTTRARLVARETDRLPGLRERSWVEQSIMPVAERMGQASLRSRLERLIAQADPGTYRDLLDDAAAEADAVMVRDQGYGRAALTYNGSVTSVADLRAALALRAGETRDRQPCAMAEVLFDLITDPATMPSTLADDPAAVEPAVPEPLGAVSVRAVPRVCLNVTVPYQVLASIWAGRATPTAFGLIELDGTGPIPARALASLLNDHGGRAVWRCHVTDDDIDSPTHGSIIGVGRGAVDTGYTPSESVKALVRAARPRCGFPGCRRRAPECDLDHVVPFSEGGPTAEDNLVPLCRFHHLVKTHLSFLATLDATTGELTWRTPSGLEIGEPSEDPPPLEADGRLPGAWPLPDPGLPPDDPPPF